MSDFVVLGKQLGELVASKNKAYGDSAEKSGGIIKILYPDGIKPEQYDAFLLIVRLLDKISRISQGLADNEDPFQDIAGYGLLGWALGKKVKPIQPGLTHSGVEPFDQRSGCTSHTCLVRCTSCFHPCSSHHFKPSRKKADDPVFSCTDCVDSDYAGATNCTGFASP